MGVLYVGKTQSILNDPDVAANIALMNQHRDLTQENLKLQAQIHTLEESKAQNELKKQQLEKEQQQLKEEKQQLEKKKQEHQQRTNNLKRFLEESTLSEICENQRKEIELIGEALVEYAERAREKNIELQQKDSEHENEIARIVESHRKQEQKDADAITELRAEKEQLAEKILSSKRTMRELWMYDYYDMMRVYAPQHCVSISLSTFGGKDTDYFIIDTDKLNDTEDDLVIKFPYLVSLEHRADYEIQFNKYTVGELKELKSIDLDRKGSQFDTEDRNDVRIVIQSGSANESLPARDRNILKNDKYTSKARRRTVEEIFNQNTSQQTTGKMEPKKEEKIQKQPQKIPAPEAKAYDITIPMYEMMNASLSQQNITSHLEIDGIVYPITLPNDVRNGTEYNVTLRVNYEENFSYKREGDDLHASFQYESKYENHVINPPYVDGSNLDDYELTLIDGSTYEFEGLGFLNPQTNQRGNYIVHIQLVEQ